MSNDFGEVFDWHDTGAGRVLWLSRHALTPAQSDDLTARLGFEPEIVTQNETYPAYSDNAVPFIHGLARTRNARTVCAVLPAHIAGAFARLLAKDRAFPLRVLVPVNKPAAQGDDGKPRPFEHSHWEEL